MAKKPDNQSTSSFVPRLLGIRGIHKGSVFILGTPKTTLGRLESNAIVLPGSAISRRHAEIAAKGRVHSIRDLKSLNGTLVNGRPVEEAVLSHGDEIGIGDNAFVLLLQPESPAPRRPLAEEIVPDVQRRTTVTFKASLPMQTPIAAAASLGPADRQLLDKVNQTLKLLYELSQDAGSEMEPGDFLTKVADTLRDFFSADTVFILKSQPGEPIYRPIAGSPPEIAGLEGGALSSMVVNRALRSKTAVLSEDAVTDRSFDRSPSIARHRIHSVMCAPLIHRDALIGALYLDTRSHARAFSEDDLRLLCIVGNQLALAIHNFTFLSQMRTAVRDLQKKVEDEQIPLIGQSEVLGKVIAIARKAADSDSTVLILGESGTGKDVLANCIHRWSRRKAGPFVVVNCVALSDELLESELFGHEKGAFTGAVKQKDGKLELADGGTVFMDEIGDIKPDVQVKLLRFLENHTFERVGGTSPIRVDARIIAATNIHLDEAVRKQLFRQDLYYRLRVVEIVMPPLRDRRDDIPLLVDFFLQKFRKEARTSVQAVSPAAVAWLQEQPWPGNIRELRNAMERALVLASGGTLDVKDFRQHDQPAAVALPDEELSYHEHVLRFKVAMIERLLVKHGGSKTAVAQELGIQLSYLSQLMKKLRMR